MTEREDIMKNIIKITALVIVSVLMIFTLFGCGKSNKMAMYDTASGLVEESAVEAGFAADDNSKSVQLYSKQTESPEAIADAASRKLIKNASLNIQTKEFDQFITSVEGKIKEYGGYVENSEVGGNDFYYSNSNRYAEMTVRVPAEKLDEFLNTVSDLATVTSKSVSVNDITSDYIDVESRIKALETEREALLGILKKANTVSETLEIQNRLSEVNADLESSKSKLKTFDSLVSYSKVTLNISEVERVTETEKEGFFAEIRRRLTDNLYNIGQGFRSFGIWFLSSLPYIAIFAVVITAVCLVLKKIVRKRKIKKQKDREIQ